VFGSVFLLGSCRVYKKEADLQIGPILLSMIPRASSDPSDNSAGHHDAPDAPAAVRDLGLRLEAAKIPVEIFVIDHIQRPSAN
jgi:uncharacterized protein (TIGR03435 family)